MKMNDYQDIATAFNQYSKREEFFTLALGLTGEAGEYADKVKKCYRDNGGRYDTATAYAMAAELGDVLWYLSQAAQKLGFDLEEIAQLNIDKLTSRANRGKLAGSGDER